MRKHHLIWIREWTLRFIHIYTCMPEWSMLTWLAEQVVFTAALCELQNPLLHQLKQFNFMTLTYSDTQARLKQSIFRLINNVFFCCNAEVQTKFLQIGSDCKNVFFCWFTFSYSVQWWWTRTLWCEWMWTASWHIWLQVLEFYSYYLGLVQPSELNTCTPWWYIRYDFNI